MRVQTAVGVRLKPNGHDEEKRVTAQSRGRKNASHVYIQAIERNLASRSIIPFQLIRWSAGDAPSHPGQSGAMDAPRDHASLATLRSSRRSHVTHGIGPGDPGFDPRPSSRFRSSLSLVYTGVHLSKRAPNNIYCVALDHEQI